MSHHLTLYRRPFNAAASASGHPTLQRVSPPNPFLSASRSDFASNRPSHHLTLHRRPFNQESTNTRVRGPNLPLSVEVSPPNPFTEDLSTRSASVCHPSDAEVSPPNPLPKTFQQSSRYLASLQDTSSHHLTLYRRPFNWYLCNC